MFEQLQDIFREVFDDPNMVITEELTANDVDNWTSLVHMELLASIEEKFGIKFSTRDMRKMKNVGALAELINRKVNTRGEADGD